VGRGGHPPDFCGAASGELQRRFGSIALLRTGPLIVVRSCRMGVRIHLLPLPVRGVNAPGAEQNGGQDGRHNAESGQSSRKPGHSHNLSIKRHKYAVLRRRGSPTAAVRWRGAQTKLGNASKASNVKCGRSWVQSLCSAALVNARNETLCLMPVVSVRFTERALK
jgi:hypothetical protein